MAPFRGVFSVVVTSVPTGSAALIAGRSVGRGSAVIQNLDAANPIFIGPDNTVTSATGFRIGPGSSLELDEVKGDIYARATGGAVDTRVLVS